LFNWLIVIPRNPQYVRNKFERVPEAWRTAHRAWHLLNLELNTHADRLWYNLALSSAHLEGYNTEKWMSSNHQTTHFNVIKKTEIYLVPNRHANKKSFRKNNFVRRSLVLSNCFIRLYSSGFKSFTWNSGSDIIWSSNRYEKFDTGYLRNIKKY